MPLGTNLQPDIPRGIDAFIMGRIYRRSFKTDERVIDIIIYANLRSDRFRIDIYVKSYSWKITAPRSRVHKPESMFDHFLTLDLL